MTRRRDLLALLTAEPRSVSSIARKFGFEKRDVADDVRHMIRSARAAGHKVIVRPAQCRSCGFSFGEDKLTKPGRCPACRSTRIYEAQIQVV